MGKNKKVLVLSCSVGKGHYSDTLGNEFIRGAQASGYETEKIHIGDHIPSGCFRCSSLASCISGHLDHFSSRSYEAILKADIIVITSSIAVASPGGRFYRHTQQVCGSIYTFHEKNGREIRNKTVYLIVSSGVFYDEYNKIVMLDSFRKYIGYFDNVQEGGHLFAFGVPTADTAKNNQAIQQVYEMGKNA